MAGYGEESQQPNVLVAEDEYFLAIDVKDLVAGLGARVVGPANSVAEARELAARNDIRLAVIDINLRGEMAFDLVDELLERSVPVILTTGYDGDGLPGRFSSCDILRKPYAAEVLSRKIGRHLPGLAKDGPASE